MTTTAAIAHPEQSDTVLVVPPGNTPAPNNVPNTPGPNNPQPNNPPPNNPAAQNQQQGTGGQSTGGGLAAIIGGLFSPAPTTGGNSGAQPGSGGVNAQAVPSVGVAGGSNGQTGGATAGSTGGSTGGNVQSGAQPGGTDGGVVQSGGQGGQANGALPAPLVLELGGTLTTIAPTIIPNAGSTGSITAYILGPGSTLVHGGSPATVSGTAVSAPGGTTTGGVGGAIASGLGYTGPLAADSIASSIRGPNMPVWVFAAAAGVIGAFAVGL